jgi:transcriptional regulator with XRE-family HTH domain
MFGANIKKYREIRGLSQKQLADKLGVSRQAMCMWESEKRELKATVLKKIAKILFVSVDDIISNEKKPKAKKSLKKDSVMLKQLKPKSVRFQINAPDANTVFLTGCFNNWKSSTTPLKKNSKGTWTVDIELKPGEYQYKFIVDDDWWIDPTNEQTISNGLGGLNSVKKVSG